ncbi:MAG: M23 family metallopeptidase [Alphaproteobacteria bacterium]|nr:M23 family metallopeptidase [Alphaproteobacteria bacterium]
MRAITRQSFTAIASAVTVPSSVRAISIKRMSRVRTNWFIIGSLFGVGASLFMNFLVSTVIIPEYQRLTDNSEAPESINVAKPLFDSPSLLEAHASLMETITPRFNKFQTIKLEVEPGDTLLDMLISQKVEEQEAHEVIAALRQEFNPRALRVGQKISLKLARHESVGDKAAVKELAINLPNLSTVELAKLKDGSFTVEAIKAELTDHAMLAKGTVRSSLYQAAGDAGIPSYVMGEIVKAFSYDVDFQREIHPGNVLEVLMDKRTTKEGKVAGHANPRYASLTLGKRKLEIFRFTDSNGRDSWFNAKGENVVKSLLKTPVHAARITSGYGMRRHPILGFNKMHQGVDFGARTGTPILAAGDGIVTYRGWKGGYGNYVQIRHNGTYSTAYAHASRFGNIRVGSRVKQGQVIAYVGTTGRSTGPHLHFEVHQNGRQVNPAAMKFDTSQALAGAELQRFKTRMGAITGEMAALRNSTTQQVASR